MKTSNFFSKIICLLAKKIIFTKLSKIRYGELIVIENQCQHKFGEASNNPPAVMHIHDQNFFKQVLFNGSNGAAESYIKKDWDTDNLTSTLELFLQNSSRLSFVERGISWLKSIIDKAIHFTNRNNPSGAKKNITAHYDLSNEFFFQFLDSSKQYSCVIFDDDKTALDAASQNKIISIADSLNIQPGDHILEIGCGWGALACYLAENYDCHITATTISNAQYVYCQQLIADKDLTHKITLLSLDYRDLHGTYDKIVSIEMIEAVGERYFARYFSKLNQLVKNNGLVYLQMILINDKSYSAYRKNIDFIKKYIFPGGHLPCPKVVANSIAKNTDLQLINLYDIGFHYDLTLKSWRKNFLINIDKIVKLHFSNEFIRLWIYYFCYCEAGFRQQYITASQAIYRKKQWL